VGGPKAVVLERAVHQKSVKAERDESRRGEAEPEASRDEARAAQHETGSLGRDDLLSQALARANLVMAWKRVKANRGSAGVDGKSIAETAEDLKTHWPRIREALLDGSYRPEPVRRVQIPKPGGGMRELGIPTVTDRLIQQALLQVLQPIIDPGFSEHSYGFRPGRRARDAVLMAQRHVQDGYRVVVDVDLEKFFDRVNHDVLMERLSRRIQADIDKLRAETRKIYVSMVGPLLAALGMSAVFLCIFFVAHSFTSGVSAGDTLLFSSIAMGYVLCSVVISSVGLFFFYPRINRLQLRGSIGMRMKRSAEPVSKRRSSPWPIRLNRPATAPPN